MQIAFAESAPPKIVQSVHVQAWVELVNAILAKDYDKLEPMIRDGIDQSVKNGLYVWVDAPKPA